jgi:hypothetical protein
MKFVIAIALYIYVTDWLWLDFLPYASSNKDKGGYAGDEQCSD